MRQAEIRTIGIHRDGLSLCEGYQGGTETQGQFGWQMVGGGNGQVGRGDGELDEGDGPGAIPGETAGAGAGLGEACDRGLALGRFRARHELRLVRIESVVVLR